MKWLTRSFALPLLAALSVSTTAHATFLNGYLVCDYNDPNPSGPGFFHQPGDPSTDLVCANLAGDGGYYNNYQWWYQSSDGVLNSWGWYRSSRQVNWGRCLNPQGATPDFYLSVGAQGLGATSYLYSIPCKKAY